MKKSLLWSPALLGIILVVGAASLSGRSNATLGQAETQPVTQLCVVSSPVPYQALTFWAGAVLAGRGDNGNDEDDNGGNGNDNNGKDKKKDHDPAPEPSTLLSFGTAILIGGGMLYYRRLRRSQK